MQPSSVTGSQAQFNHMFAVFAYQKKKKKNSRKIIVTADVSCCNVELIQLPDWEKKIPQSIRGLSCIAVAEELRSAARGRELKHGNYTTCQQQISSRSRNGASQIKLTSDGVLIASISISGISPVHLRREASGLRGF